MAWTGPDVAVSLPGDFTLRAGVSCLVISTRRPSVLSSPVHTVNIAFDYEPVPRLWLLRCQAELLIATQSGFLRVGSFGSF
jgi:hypothetical protein